MCLGQWQTRVRGTPKFSQSYCEINSCYSHALYLSLKLTYSNNSLYGFTNIFYEMNRYDLQWSLSNTHLYHYMYLNITTLTVQHKNKAHKIWTVSQIKFISAYCTCCLSSTLGCTHVMWTLLATWSIAPRTKPCARAFITNNSTSFTGNLVSRDISSKVNCRSVAGRLNVIYNEQ